eukprot:g1301.t1
MRAYLRRIDELINENVTTKKCNTTKSKKARTYLQNTVEEILRSDFDTEIYPTTIESISIADDGGVERIKQPTYDIKYDHSMESHWFQRECREELAYDLQNTYETSSVTNSLSSQEVDKSLLGLHTWIQTVGMAHTPLFEKVLFLQQVLNSLKSNLNGSYFKNIIDEIIALKPSQFMNTNIHQNVIDEVNIHDFLIKRFCHTNPIGIKEHLQKYLNRTAVKNYEDIVQALSSKSVDRNDTNEDGDIGKKTNSTVLWQWGDEDSNYTITAAAEAIETVFNLLQKTKALKDGNYTIPIYKTFTELDKEIIANEITYRKTLGKLHPIMLLKYLQDLENYKNVFYNIKHISYLITQTLDGVLMKVVKGLIIEDVQIFDAVQYSSFLKKMKARYYDISLNDDLIMNKSQQEEESTKKKSSNYWAVGLRDDIESFVKQVEEIVTILPANQSKDGSINKIQDLSSKKSTQYWGVNDENDESVKINLGALKIPEPRNTRQRRREIINSEWTSGPIEVSSVMLDDYEDEEDLGKLEEANDVVTELILPDNFEDKFSCIKDKPPKVSPLEHLINHHWNNLFLNENPINSEQAKTLLERFLHDDEDIEDTHVAEFIKDVHNFVKKDEYGTLEDDSKFNLNKSDLLKYIPEAIELLPSMPHEDDEEQEVKEYVMSKTTYSFVDAIIYGIMYQLCSFIWPKYDVDGSGAIGPNELSEILKHEAALYCAKNVCEAVVQSLDEDGNMEITLYELTYFFHVVVMMSHEVRNNYQKRSESHKTLMMFSELMLEKIVRPESFDYVPEAVQKRRDEQQKKDEKVVDLHDKGKEEVKKAEERKKEQEINEREEEALQKAREEEEALKKAREEEEALKKAREEEEALKKAREEEEALKKAREEEEALKKAQEEKEALEKAAKEEEEEKRKIKRLSLNPGDTIWLKDINGRWASEEGYDVNHVFKCTFRSKNTDSSLSVTLHDENDEEVEDMVEDELVLDKEAKLSVGYKVWVMNPERDGWEAAQTYPGVVSAINGQSYSIFFDDGDFLDNILRSEIFRYFEQEVI